MYPYYSYYHGCPQDAWSHHYQGYGYWAGPQMPYWPVAHCPVCHRPYPLCTCKPEGEVKLPQEVLIDDASSPREFFVGGLSDAEFTLEYMATTEAATPTIGVTIVDEGGTHTWQEDPVPESYQVKNDFAPAPPGARVTVEVTEAIARMRWWESVEY